MTSNAEDNVLNDGASALCASNDLLLGGLGVRFSVKDSNDKTWPAFVVRHQHGVSAFINRCSHLALELDWEPGHFFDVDDAEHLVCATHGALYVAQSGDCAGGPCNGMGLEALRVEEEADSIYLKDPAYQLQNLDC